MAAPSRRALVALHRALACIALLLASLVLVPVVYGALWIPAVAAIEWGHLFALFALAFALLGARRPGLRASSLALLVAALLFLSPLARALVAARGVDHALGAFASGPARALPGAPARPEPLRVRELFSLGLPALVPTRHVYRTVSGAPLALDLYRSPGAPRPMPLVLVLHGGSWARGDRTQLPEIDQYLAARGYAVASADYRLAPASRFPAQLDDTLAALDWLREHGAELGLDPSRVALLGRSAGGHLALLAGYARGAPAVRGVVALYPPSDLTWSWNHPTAPRVLDSHAALIDFLGAPPSQSPALYAAASPYEQLASTHTTPPTLLLHGGRDDLVFYAQTERFAARLEAAHVPHALLTLPWATHGFDANLAGPSGQLAVYAIERFLGSVLR